MAGRNPAGKRERTMFKFAVIALSLFFVGTAFAYSRNVPAVPQYSTEIGRVSIVGELPEVEAPVITLRNMTITVPHFHDDKRPSQRWTCGAFQDNMLGGSQRTCEYK